MKAKHPIKESKDIPQNLEVATVCGYYVHDSDRYGKLFIDIKDAVGMGHGKDIDDMEDGNCVD